MELYHVGKQKGKGISRYQIELKDAHNLARNGLMTLSISVGMKVLEAMIYEEVDEIAGIKGKHINNKNVYRHGTEATSVVLGGQKAKIEKPRLRSKAGKEVSIETLNQFQSEDALNTRILKQILAGIKTRDYGGFQDASPDLDTFGTSKSSVSRRFIQETTKGMQEFVNRPLEDDTYPIMMFDGVGIGDYLVIVALGIKTNGEKRILGIREGSSESSEVCKSLISDIIERGIDANIPRLFVLDGSKALSKAVKETFNKAHIQRCQLHKKRNVEGHLPDSEKARIINEMNAAYAEFEYKEAKLKLEKLAKSLDYKYPSAADSIREGLDETLTLHKLKIPGLLRISLASTNPIESAIGTIRQITVRVKRWRNGQQVLRWLSCGFLTAEKQFRKIKGYKLLPTLTQILDGREVSENEIAI